MPSPSSVQKFWRCGLLSGGTARNASGAARPTKVGGSMADDQAGPTVATRTLEMAGPMALAEWAMERVAKARATGTRASPTAEMLWPIQRRRKVGWDSGARAAGRRRIPQILLEK